MGGDERSGSRGHMEEGDEQLHSNQYGWVGDERLRSNGHGWAGDEHSGSRGHGGSGTRAVALELIHWLGGRRAASLEMNSHARRPGGGALHRRDGGCAGSIMASRG
ncbi:hypothetical protein L210DRAFT_3225586 [Boletus edulis BED1]|uniref:Uncharacterized protein n=1 Tax=Boletus edulis BED1 TaxID=1328754 RepID=A0AAD4BFG5_BOLED|nr:hypothetical protein L210DRAFT_3225586 [Boletus edulis BED1]